MGNAHPSLYPYEPFPAQDMSLVIAVGNDSQFARLCCCLGLPALATDERFATMASRNSHRGDLRKLIIEKLQAKPAAEWTEELKQLGVPAAPILTMAQGVDFADELGLNPVALAGEGGRQVPTVKHPITYSRHQVDYFLAPPRLDEHRDLILRWLKN